MIIEQMRVKPYHFPFRIPFSSANRNLRHRRGFYVQLRSAEGISGLGEAAPLPGFTWESFDDVRMELSALQELISKKHPTAQISGASGIRHDFLEESSPTVRFALESTLFDIFALEKNVPLNRVFSEYPSSTLSVNAAVGLMDKTQSLETIRKYIREGYTTFKLKIGRSNFREDVEIIQSLVDLMPENCHLRLDANQQWTYNEAVSNITALSNFPVEYLEQPIPSADIDSLKMLTDQKLVPIAADEAADTIESIQRIFDTRAADYLILKPAFLGVTPTIRAIELAKNSGIKVVLTSGLDTIVGISVTAHIASAFLPEMTHGLATGTLLEYSWSEPIHTIDNGRLHLSDAPGIGLPASVRTQVFPND